MDAKSSRSPMHSPPETSSHHFVTGRLIQRRPAAQDSEALVALEGEADVAEYLRARGADLSDIPARIKARIAADANLPASAYGWWVIAGKDDGVFHGRGLLAPAWDGADPEFGIYLRRGSRSRGLATEAATALLDHAFFTLKLPRVIGVGVRKEGGARKLALRLRLSHQGKVILHGIEADRFVITANGWLPRRR
jgi:RimJ/RimL family protein N-acetyltransferase